MRQGPQRAGHQCLPGSPALFDQVCQDLAVHLGTELMTSTAQFPAKFRRVVDDSVVHQGEVAGAVSMRMGVANGGRAMRCPPGVPDAEPTSQRPPGHHLALQARQATRRPNNVQIPGARVAHRDPGGVVASVLQLRESGQQKLCRPPARATGHDPAHCVPHSSFRQRFADRVGVDRWQPRRALCPSSRSLLPGARPDPVLIAVTGAGRPGLPRHPQHGYGVPSLK